MKNETINGYAVLKGICFNNERGFVVAMNPAAVEPYVTWQFSETNGERDYYWGRYYQLKESAFDCYIERTRNYSNNHPDVSVKYNYLAAVEMATEGNYNMVDGVINNTPKPSLIQQMNDYELLIALNSENNVANKDTALYRSLDTQER